MSRIWRWVIILCGIMLIFAAALIGVSYVTGGSVQRLLNTTDIADMTKFISRDQLEVYVNQAFDLFSRLTGK